MQDSASQMNTEEKHESSVLEPPLLAIEQGLNPMEKVVENYFHPNEIVQKLDPAEAALREDVLCQTYLVYDIFEDEDGYILEADLPGRQAEDVNVTISCHILKITADRKLRQKKLGKYEYKYHHQIPLCTITTLYNTPPIPHYDVLSPI